MSSASSSRSQIITAELRAWILEQARRGCRPEDVLQSMKTSGWQEDVAVAAMEETLSTALADRATLEPPQTSPSESAQGQPQAQAPVQAPVQAPAQAQAEVVRGARALPEPAIDGYPTSVWAGDREVQIVMSMRNPRVVVFGGLLSAQECQDLVVLSRERLRRSETVKTDTGTSEVNEARTSDGMFFQRGEHELCTLIEARIAALLNWPVENGEGLQVLRYRPGARYEAHYDYFDPAQPGTPAILRRGGQRVGTLIMYLQAPDRGGGTSFPDVQLEVSPVPGHAVFFSYDRPEPSTRSLHAGSPVLAGEKWIATKWLREGRFD